MRSIGAVLAVLFVVVRCGGRDLERAPNLWEGVDGEADRRFIEVAFDTLWTLGAADDSLLANPAHPRAVGDAFVVFDAIRKQLIAVGPHGEVLWATGQPGGGPGEFRNVRDVQVHGGNVYLNDLGNARIAIVGSDGRLVAYVPTSAADYAEVFAPTSLGIVLVAAAPDALQVIDPKTGLRTGTRSMPWAPFGSLSLVVKQGRIASDSGSWVYVFSQGNGWFAFDDTSATVGRGRFVEHADFPTLVVSERGNEQTRSMLEWRPCTACGASLRRDTLYVHFGGRSADSFRVVDVYSVADSAYLHSFRLPSAAKSVEVGDNGVILMVLDEPYPRLIAIRRSVTVPVKVDD